MTRDDMIEAIRLALRAQGEAHMANWPNCPKTWTLIDGDVAKVEIEGELDLGLMADVIGAAAGLPWASDD